ncbi:unnamed protein product [Nesidiocoris tenuis]|uniref:Uncharacterized protein n=1 Tax=Nesidiocoris tenuis TaxID=355587 RepID=A0A6H5GWM2_9HEMI|nr:unnamed protein product [Nesidiocoris tenuis]
MAQPSANSNRRYVDNTRHFHTANNRHLGWRRRCTTIVDPVDKCACPPGDKFLSAANPVNDPSQLQSVAHSIAPTSRITIAPLRTLYFLPVHCTRRSELQMVTIPKLRRRNSRRRWSQKSKNV